MTTKIVLYKEHASDLPEAIKYAKTDAIDMIITPISNPLFYRDFDALKQRHVAFTRPDLIMEPITWCKITDSIDCDSDDDNVRRHSEAIVKQELGFAQHVVQTGRVLVQLKGLNCMNLARVITRELVGTCKRYFGFGTELVVCLK